MVALAKLIRPWNDHTTDPAPQDGTLLEVEDSNGDRVYVEWQEGNWVIAQDTETSGWIILANDIARWRRLV